MEGRRESRQKSVHLEVIPSNPDVLNADDGVIRRASVANPRFASISLDAKDASNNEHSMSAWQALRVYPKAVAWSLLLSTAVIMEGYDVVLLANFYALPLFNQKYGSITPDGTYEGMSALVETHKLHIDDLL